LALARSLDRAAARISPGFEGGGYEATVCHFVQSSELGLAGPDVRAGAEAGFGFKAHPHMLRHACGYALANKGHDTRALQAYLGHKNIQHTVRYTELSATRFKDFWRS